MCKTIALLASIGLSLLGSVAVADSISAQMAKVYGAAWSPALGAWLPSIGNGFEPWRRGQASLSSGADYFVCGPGQPAPAAPPARFDYATSGCTKLHGGTGFVYGTAGPLKGRVVYDLAHRIVLYQQGCCGWGTGVLASNIGSPPLTVRGADLSGVRTVRGIRLGMTPAEAIAVYGSAVAHAVAGAPGVSMLSYTTLEKGAAQAGNECGQFENFAFRAGRLVYIELLSGC